MPRILIVEDNARLLKMNKMNLEQAGYKVCAATNGEEAIAIMDNKNIDLLLLDLLMPKVNGFGVMRHVRSKKYTFPIVVLTNLDERADRKRCRELGAADFLVKSDMESPDLASKAKQYLTPRS